MSAVRVLHVLPALSGYGAERQVADLLPHLQCPELTAGVLTIYRAPEPDDAEEAPPYPVFDGGRERRSDYFFLHRLVAKMREFRPDVVHAHTHAGKYWARAAALLSGVPAIVYTEHNPCDPRRSALERFVDPLLHSLTDRIVTFFSEQRLLLAKRQRIPVHKILAIPNGLAVAGVSALKCVPPDGAFSVLLVGRLEYQKNQQLALRALAELNPALRRRIHLSFAGTGSDDDALRALAFSLDVAESVSFLGYRRDVRALMARSDVVLMTSHFEGMPLTLIEAMLAGTPIVTTPWTGAHEMLDGGRLGFITAGWHPAATAETLERALSSPAARLAMARSAAVHAAREYSIQRTAQRHKALYFELAGSRAS